MDFSELVKDHRPVLQKIRDHHHQLARLVAEGRRTTDIAFETGMSISRISILKSDPAFMELVEAYRMNLEQIKDLAYADHQKKMALTASLALDELNGRLEDTPEDFSHDQLFQYSIGYGDRLGYGKIVKTVNANLNLQVDTTNLAERAAAEVRRADQLSAPPVTGADKPGSG